MKSIIEARNQNNGNPSDGITYFLSQGTITNVTTSGQAITRIYIPYTGTITGFAGTYTVTGTLGSGESSGTYIRLNNATDYLIASSTLTASNNPFSNSSLNIPVTAGDYIEFKWVNPTYATNPLAVGYSHALEITTPDASTASTTTVSIPNLDIAIGLGFFLVTFAFLVLFFKKPKWT